MRLVHEHFGCDPEGISEAQMREYFLFVKLKKRWQPKTIRQAAGAARMFFGRLLGRSDWTLFGQIRARDHDRLPPVLSREQVARLIGHIRLRRYRTPLKLIYCCGLRLSECLGLTIHDIQGSANKLLIRGGKGCTDRVVPLPTPMYEELRQ
jgi:integrase